MIQMCSLSTLRSNLGRYVHKAGHHGDRIVILKNGREVAGLVGVGDLNLLDNAATRSLEYKAYQVADEMLRWRLIKEGLEQVQRRA